VKWSCFEVVIGGTVVGVVSSEQSDFEAKSDTALVSDSLKCGFGAIFVFAAA